MEYMYNSLFRHTNVYEKKLMDIQLQAWKSFYLFSLKATSTVEHYLWRAKSTPQPLPQSWIAFNTLRTFLHSFVKRPSHTFITSRMTIIRFRDLSGRKLGGFSELGNKVIFFKATTLSQGKDCRSPYLPFDYFGPPPPHKKISFYTSFKNGGSF
jgi:hypothetical protein